MNLPKGLKAGLLLLSVAMAAPALAADCSNAVTQADIDQCFGSNYAAADKILNNLYQQLMKKLGPQDRAMLQDAQRTWVSFRDKHCAFVANPAAGGSIYPTIVSGCATTVTVQRSKQLRERLYCQEGDNGCGS